MPTMSIILIEVACASDNPRSNLYSVTVDNKMNYTAKYKIDGINSL